MKVEYTECDFCLSKLNADEKLKKGLFKNGRSVYIRYGSRLKKVDICNKCWVSLDTIVNNLKEQK